MCYNNYFDRMEKKDTNVEPDYFTAIHEAGHVVAELKFGKNLLKHVTIIPTEDYLGHVASKSKNKMIRKMHESTLSGAEEQYFKHLMVAYMAGPAAEARARKIIDFTNGSRGDFYQLYDLAFEMFFSEPVTEAYCDYIIEEARRFVLFELNWKCIVAIANELLLRKRLNRKQCKEIYQKTLLSKE